MNRRLRRPTGVAVTVIAVAITGIASTGAAPSVKSVTKTESFLVTGANPTELVQHNQAALHAADPSRVPGVVRAGKDVSTIAPQQPLAVQQAPASSTPGAPPSAPPTPPTPANRRPVQPQVTSKPRATAGTVTPSLTTGAPTQTGDEYLYNWCISAAGATSDAGVAVNKTFYCRVNFLLVRKIHVSSTGAQTVVGTINARAVMYQGTDATSAAGTARTDRGAYGYLRFDELTTSGDYDNPATVLNGGIQCSPGTGCVQSGDQSVGRTIADWKYTANDVYGTYSVPAGSGVDTKGFGSVRFRAAATDGTVGGLAETYSLSNQIRCDSATYLNRPQGCIIIGVVDEFSMSNNDPNVNESAQNIWEGWTNPGVTLPKVATKNVPGRGPEKGLYPNGIVTPSPLHRIWYDTTTITANNNKALNDCKFFWGAAYATSAGYARDCDEFPFKTTKEGAALGNGNYVVKAITAADNQRAGSAFSVWESNHRILDGDMLYVGIYSSGAPSK